MTDRIHSLLVVLKQDMRDDDAQPLIDAISLLRGVAMVEPQVADIDSQMAEVRAIVELRGQVLGALGLRPYPLPKESA